MLVYCSKKHANKGSHSFCTHCGEALPLTVGQVIDNRYEIARILGQGGFGRSYLAIDRQKSRQKCVLKEFAPQVVKPQDLQKAKELFEREASVLKKIQHPQIPRFHSSFQAKIGTKDFFFLVQDYIEGDNYYQLFQQRQSLGKSFSEEEVVNLLHHILPVLTYIHFLDIVHRDISPDNLILRQSDNLPVLIDFGGVKQLPASQGFWRTQLSGEGTLLGKKGYAPEEQLIQGKVFKSSDLYSLAVTALVLLTGKEPQSLYDSYNGTWYWGKEIKVSPKLETVFKKMLAYKPSDAYGGLHQRYQKADQVLKDLPAPSSLHTANTILNPVKSQNTYMTKLKTMVAAPGIKNAKAISSKFHSQTQSVVQQIPMPAWLRPFAVSFLGTSAIVLTGAGVWAAGNYVFRSVTSITVPEISLPQIPLGGNPASQPVSNKNGKRNINEVFSRLKQLEISSSFFTKTVNEIFYTRKPELKGRSLSGDPQDAGLRDEWNSIADDLLKNIEKANLSESARRKLGSYTKKDYDQWGQLAREGKLKKYKSLDELKAETYEKFEPLFPGQERGKLNQQTFLQIWYAIAADKVSQARKN
ncbi:serine/threonine-protein kinase [Anabaena lutea]|uniref:non-specific serine/threonine protein kinase n=1 Tax=Anabaena lutea FACHB-196 TaxID=2692881 RepID=A0ABR8FJQ7_9NOST|nr:serine/threonine-protein kinase [Anabaena lutea]MBD2569828.1 serine/threonine protein kinase [Anabaena lutea FACHB-196]